MQLLYSLTNWYNHINNGSSMKFQILSAKNHWKLETSQPWGCRPEQLGLGVEWALSPRQNARVGWNSVAAHIAAITGLMCRAINGKQHQISVRDRCHYCCSNGIPPPNVSSPSCCSESLLVPHWIGPVKKTAQNARARKSMICKY